MIGDVIESLPHEDMTMCDIKTGTGSVELPRYLCEMYRRGCEHLSTEQANEFQKFLMNRKDAFADPNMPTQRAKSGEHCIDLNE